jgi:hypothetical protein
MNSTLFKRLLDTMRLPACCVHFCQDVFRLFVYDFGFDVCVCVTRRRDEARGRGTRRGRATDTAVCVPPWLGLVCQTCHGFHTVYQCSHLIWGATSTPRYSTVPDGTRRYPTVPDGTRRYPTVPDGTRRYPTVPDGTRRYSTVLDGTRRYSTVLDGNLSFCVILVTLDILLTLIILITQSTYPLPVSGNWSLRTCQSEAGASFCA